jgi:bis(5'-nucleosyl)-tetraphosphatase (symmetrical)
VQDILDAPDRRALLDWLSQQPLALRHGPCLMVHAGVLPQWSAEQTLQLAGEVSAVLKSPQRGQFLTEMYGNLPDRWHEGLQGMDRLRVIVNALTRLRFCTPQGQMEFQAKEGLDAAPEGFMPWFDVPNRQTAEVMVAFGHWSTAGGLWRPNVVCLDTGCVWGRSLSALRWTPGTGVDAVQQGEWIEEPAA